MKKVNGLLLALSLLPSLASASAITVKHTVRAPVSGAFIGIDLGGVNQALSSFLGDDANSMKDSSMGFLLAGNVGYINRSPNKLLTGVLVGGGWSNSSSYNGYEVASDEKNENSVVSELDVTGKGFFNAGIMLGVAMQQVDLYTTLQYVRKGYDLGLSLGEEKETVATEASRWFNGFGFKLNVDYRLPCTSWSMGAFFGIDFMQSRETVFQYEQEQDGKEPQILETSVETSPRDYAFGVTMKYTLGGTR